MKTPISQQTRTEPMTLLKMVGRRWGLLAGVLGVILAGAGVAITMAVWEPVYEARQFVQVVQNREFTDINSAGNSKTDPNNMLGTIESEFLLDQLLHDEELLKIRPDIDISQLRRIVSHERSGGEMHSIICRDRSPKYAALAAQKLTINFLEFQKAKKTISLQELEANLNKDIAKIKMEIAQLETSLQNKNTERLKPSSGNNDLIDLDGSLRVEMQLSLSNEKKQRDLLMHDRAELQLSLDEIEKQFDESVKSEIEASVNASPAIEVIDSELRNLKIQKADLRLGPSHPRVASIILRINKARQQRQILLDRQMASRKIAWESSNKRELTEAIAKYDRSIKSAEFTIKKSIDEINNLMSEFKNTNQLNFDFDRLSNDQQRAHGELSKLNAQLSNINSKKVSLDRVKLLGDNQVAIPTEPVEQYPYKILGMVVIGGLLIPFALAFLWEFHLCRISSPEQIEHQLSVQLLGEVADLPTRSNRPAALNSKRGQRQLRLYEDSVDNLSAILSHASHQTPLVMSVTSAASNEGKTTLSSQLAISAARSHLGRTLLIDADLRSPSMHRVFSDSLDVGLADVLSGAVSLDKAVSATDIENLDLLTAGRIRNNPRRYFSDSNWSALLELAKQHYDHVIVDTPPVLAASESLAISKPCDFALICVLRDVSRADAVRRAHDRLVAADVTVIGCAFGGVPQNEYAIRYGNYGYNMS